MLAEKVIFKIDWLRHRRSGYVVKSRELVARFEGEPAGLATWASSSASRAGSLAEAAGR